MLLRDTRHRNLGKNRGVIDLRIPMTCAVNEATCGHRTGMREYNRWQLRKLRRRCLLLKEARRSLLPFLQAPPRHVSRLPLSYTMGLVPILLLVVEGNMMKWHG